VSDKAQTNRDFFLARLNKYVRVEEGHSGFIYAINGGVLPDL